MVTYLSLDKVIRLHENILEITGGGTGIRDIGGLESAIAIPKMSAFGVELYPTLVEKAAILGFSLIANHPFIDGNKRIGHAAMEMFLLLNGFEIDADVDEQEQVILAVASGTLSKESFTQWLETRIIELSR